MFLRNNVVRRAKTLLWGTLAAMMAVATALGQDEVTYNRHIRPLLSDKCFLCHGPDAGTRKAKLRLDVPEIALDRKAIVPGKPQESLLIQHIISSKPDEVMPPPETHKSLSDSEKELFRRWIAQGAKYEKHWAYIPPVKPEIPNGQNAIDYLVRQRLEKLGLQLSPKADRRTLARRLHFDLVGLPAKPEEVQAFEKDASPQAYSTLVEGLLSSPQYGERMAIGWLDIVRFADTIGYHSDNPRNVWPYRDYVIRSFNENKPFDRFTIEQLAGDLLQDSRVEQKIGSAFNRLLLTTEEGGAQPKDYEYRMLTDRVRAVGAVWLGQTIGCATCHDHKFDPITMRDFYSMGAFFADISEGIIGRREEGLLLANEQQKAELARLEAEVSRLQKDYDTAKAEHSSTNNAGEAGEKKPQDKEGKEATPELEALKAKLTAARKSRDEYETSLPHCLVSVSTNQPRTVHILPRGNFLNEADGQIVRAAFPAYLDRVKHEPGSRPNAETGDAPATLTRLDLANWLVSPDHPLVARVVMNRLWKQFFGIGLSKVLDDLGAQGETPPNQALLDWLACEFRDSGWDLKHMVRLIVNSETYQQVSTPTPELRSNDPANRELACQSRWRLDSELVRDTVLSISGLLCTNIGGPSIKPYQPDGYWENLNFPVRTYEATQGTNQYRRGLYVWWQRSYLHPAMVAFDAPSREECTAERTRSNIPQQALVLLNDPTFVEAARAFAVRILKEGGDNTDARLTWAWRQALVRDPHPDELDVIANLLARFQSEYRENKSAAEAFLNFGQYEAPGDLDPCELAAWANVARVILNLHETITRS